jgi:pilus assembly protein CpaC
VQPSFSTLNQQIAVDNIPGLNSRNVKTTVDLRTGQWLAIGGLLQDEQQGLKSGVPFASDIPVVGALFGRTQVQRNETELIVLVSPEIIHPTDAREMPLMLPGMEMAEPGDVALFLGGAYAAQYGCPPRRQPASAPPTCDPQANRQAMQQMMSRPEYQQSEKYYIYGQHGTSQ